MRVITHLLCALSMALGGCANFKVVTDFAQATKQVTTPVRDEMDFITATCMREAGLRSGFELDPQLAQLMKANGDLLEQARKLIESDILLIAGEARIAADQVRAAVQASAKVIAKVEKVKVKLAKIGAVLDFVATVFTGSGTKIFEAAIALKDELDKP